MAKTIIQTLYSIANYYILLCAVHVGEHLVCRDIMEICEKRFDETSNILVYKHKVSMYLTLRNKPPYPYIPAVGFIKCFMLIIPWTIESIKIPVYFRFEVPGNDRHSDILRVVTTYT
jgi:hypothetical protein